MVTTGQAMMLLGLTAMGLMKKDTVLMASTNQARIVKGTRIPQAASVMLDMMHSVSAGKVSVMMIMFCHYNQSNGSGYDNRNAAMKRSLLTI